MSEDRKRVTELNWNYMRMYLQFCLYGKIVYKNGREQTSKNYWISEMVGYGAVWKMNLLSNTISSQHGHDELEESEKLVELKQNIWANCSFQVIFCARTWEWATHAHFLHASTGENKWKNKIQ